LFFRFSRKVESQLFLSSRRFSIMTKYLKVVANVQLNRTESRQNNPGANEAALFCGTWKGFLLKREAIHFRTTTYDRREEGGES